MNAINLDCFKRPALWQRSEAAFWDDEHISKYMLDAHLDNGMDAASRKSDFMDKSVNWLATVIPAGAKLLDLGCGPGLYGARFAKKGYDYTGIDYSRRSIAYAQEHEKHGKYIYQNYLDMDYESAFDAAIIIYCDYPALVKSEREVFLKKAYRALRPGGVFVLDAFTKAHYADMRESATWEACENGGFWSPKPYVCAEARCMYENNTVCADQYIVMTAEGMTEHIVWDTCYSNEALAADLTAAGFKPVGFYGDAAGAEFSEESKTLCCVARKE